MLSKGARRWNPSTITFPGGVPASVWVEWVTPGIAPATSTLTLRMQDSVSGNDVWVDQLVFHPFTSVVIVLGGRTQVPADPIADPEHGTFQSAIDLYREGYDVHMYNEADVDNINGFGPPFAEVVSAVENRGVTHVAIFGYSYGGGATKVLAGALNSTPTTTPFSIDYTAYIDGVRNGGYFAETDPPPGTQYHLSIFQEGSVWDEYLDGGPVAGAENINVEDPLGWGLSVTHYTIDNDLTVGNHVKSRLRAHVNK